MGQTHAGQGDVQAIPHHIKQDFSTLFDFIHVLDQISLLSGRLCNLGHSEAFLVSIL